MSLTKVVTISLLRYLTGSKNFAVEKPKLQRTGYCTTGTLLWYFFMHARKT